MSSKVKVAVVGAGYWGKNLVRNFAKLGVLAGVCDENVNISKSITEQYQCPILTWQHILDSKEIDAVAIAAPAVNHGPLSEAALAEDKHVFVEKPLALNVAVAKRLCLQAEQKQKILMVGHLLQYHSAFLKLKSLVMNGELGRLQYLYSHRLNFGKIRREEDILWSFAPHDISMILSLIGCEPTEVRAVGGYYLHQSIADTTTTHLTFPNGEQAHVFVSWLHPYKEQKLVVVGESGMMVFDDGQDWDHKLVLYRHRIEWRQGMPLPNKSDAEYIPLTKMEPLLNECQHFIDCIEQKKQPSTDGQEGLRVLKVLDQATRALANQSHRDSNRDSQQRFPEVMVHETSYVDEQVQIGVGTKIWHYSHILANTHIGNHCVIGQNVMIGPKVSIGHHCKIQNNVSLYQGVVLEDGVFCGPSCVFTNVNTPRAEIERKNEFQVTYVERGATIGANATIICGVRIGAYSFIGAGAVVTKEVLAHALVVGNPSRQIGWVSHAGEVLGEDLICPREKRRYRITSVGSLEELVELRQQEVN